MLFISLLLLRLRDYPTGVNSLYNLPPSRETLPRVPHNISFRTILETQESAEPSVRSIQPRTSTAAQIIVRQSARRHVVQQPLEELKVC